MTTNFRDFYYTNSVQSSALSPVHTIATTLTEPIRWICGGNKYRVIHKDHGFSHLYVKEVPPKKIVDIGKKALGVLSCFTLFPFIGLGIKLALEKGVDTKENYGIAQVFEEHKWPMLIENKMKKKPIKITPSKEEIEKAQKKSPEDLLLILPSESKMPLKERESLFNWLLNVVPDKTKYSYIPKNTLENAVEQLKKGIQLLTVALESSTCPLTLSEKEQVLLDILDASKQCSPTWIEVVEKKYVELKCNSYAELKCNSLVRERLLRHVQSIKEELILKRIYDGSEGSSPNNHWNKLDAYRALIGEQIGLDTGRTHFDSVYPVNSFEKFLNKEKYLRTFFEQFTLDTLIGHLKAKIALDNEGTNGFDQEIAIFLEHGAECYAKKMGLNTKDVDFDAATYVMNTCFDQKIQNRRYTYAINDIGVQLILEELKLITPNRV